MLAPIKNTLQKHTEGPRGLARSFALAAAPYAIANGIMAAMGVDETRVLVTNGLMFAGHAMGVGFATDKFYLIISAPLATSAVFTIAGAPGPAGATAADGVGVCAAAIASGIYYWLINVKTLPNFDPRRTVKVTLAGLGAGAVMAFQTAVHAPPTVRPALKSEPVATKISENKICNDNAIKSGGVVEINGTRFICP